MRTSDQRPYVPPQVRHCTAIVAVAAAVTVLTACSVATTAPLQGASQPAAAPSSVSCSQNCRLLNYIDYDYDPAETPGDLAGLVDLVVIGAVVDMRPGRLTGTDDPLPHVVVSVRVEKTLRGSASGASDGQIFVELPVPNPRASAELKSNLPVGSRLALFVSDYTTPKDDNPVQNQDAGRPPGSRLFAPAAQGLLKELPGGLMGGFVDLQTQPEAWKRLKSLNDVESAIN